MTAEPTMGNARALWESDLRSRGQLSELWKRASLECATPESRSQRYSQMKGVEWAKVTNEERLLLVDRVRGGETPSKNERSVRTKQAAPPAAPRQLSNWFRRSAPAVGLLAAPDGSNGALRGTTVPANVVQSVMPPVVFDSAFEDLADTTQEPLSPSLLPVPEGISTLRTLQMIKLTFETLTAHDAGYAGNLRGVLGSAQSEEPVPTSLVLDDEDFPEPDEHGLFWMHKSKTEGTHPELRGRRTRSASPPRRGHVHSPSLSRSRSRGRMSAVTTPSGADDDAPSTSAIGALRVVSRVEVARGMSTLETTRGQDLQTDGSTMDPPLPTPELDFVLGHAVRGAARLSPLGGCLLPTLPSSMPAWLTPSPLQQAPSINFSAAASGSGLPAPVFPPLAPSVPGYSPAFTEVGALAAPAGLHPLVGMMPAQPLPWAVPAAPSLAPPFAVPQFGLPAFSHQPAPGGMLAVPPGVDPDRYRRRPQAGPGGGAPTVEYVMATATSVGFYQRLSQAKALHSNGKQTGISIKALNGGGAINIWTQGNEQPFTRRPVAKITISGNGGGKESILSMISPWTLPLNAGNAAPLAQFMIPAPANPFGS